MKTDQHLQIDIMDELEYNPAISAENIQVAIKDGIVTLGGYAPNYANKYAAEKASFRVAGVKAVVNHIDVKLVDSNRRSDSYISTAVLNAFEWNIHIPSSSVRYTVEHGVVTLKGEVEWAYQRDAASSAVRYLVGVVDVRNQISVQNNAQPRDAKMRIKKAILRAAKIHAKNIFIETMDGTVVLKGKVKSYAEMEDINWAAWAAPGIRSVENQIALS